jgi:hypothetical protein
MPKAKGSARPGVGRRGERGSAEAPHSDESTLGEIGITKKQSSVWQRIAELAEDEKGTRQVSTPGGNQHVRTTPLSYRPADKVTTPE